MPGSRSTSTRAGRIAIPGKSCSQAAVDHRDRSENRRLSYPGKDTAPCRTSIAPQLKGLSRGAWIGYKQGKKFVWWMLLSWPLADFAARVIKHAWNVNKRA